MWLRLLFLCILLALFLSCYYSLPGAISKSHSTVLADFAGRFVMMYMIGQLFFLLIIGPTYVASAIAEERQRGTLDYLFSSDLTSYEIIVGKYFSRLFLLLHFVLIGLAPLMLAQMIGGVSLELILGMLLGTIGCLASLTALTLLISVVSRDNRQALLRSFAVFGLLVLIWFTARWYFPLGVAMYSPFHLNGDLYSLFVSSNPLQLTYLLSEQQAKVGNIDGLPLRWFGECFVIHAVIAVLLVTATVLSARRQFLHLKNALGKQSSNAQGITKPAIWTNFPLYWKEKYVFHGVWRRLSWSYLLKHVLFPTVTLRILGFVAFGIVYLSVLLTVMLLQANDRSVRAFISEITPVALWAILALLFCSMLAGIMRTASGIAAEKDADTWDALVASPVSTNDLLLSRLYAGFLSARGLFILSMLIMIPVSAIRFNDYTNGYLRYIPGGSSNVVFILANVLYCWFALCLASYFSLSSNSSIRNVMSTIMVLLMLNALPLVAGMFFYGNNSTRLVVAVLYFFSDPISAFVIIGLGLLAMVCVVFFYRNPRLRWLFNIVKWLGNMLLLNAVFLLIFSGFAFAFEGYMPFDRMVLFFAPWVMDHILLSQNILVIQNRYYGDANGLVLMQLSSSVAFALFGVVLLLLALRKLKRASGRVEYSRLAAKKRREMTEATATNSPAPVIGAQAAC